MISDEEDTLAEFNPDWVTTPGSHLQEYFEEGVLTVDAFMAKTGFPIKFVEDLLEGSVEITEEIAQKISLATRGSKEYWLNLEKFYRDGLARNLIVG